jgi:error-prone DNA polymerase
VSRLLYMTESLSRQQHAVLEQEGRQPASGESEITEIKSAVLIATPCGSLPPPGPLARVQDGQPYRSLSDFWQRARPSRPLAERLAEIGALDCLRDKHVTRRDLLLQINELHRQSKTRAAGSGQVDSAAQFRAGVMVGAG